MMNIKAMQEQLSLAYVQAVASVAGFSTYTFSVDDDSIDIGIAAKGSLGTLRSPRLEVQLKAPFRRNLMKKTVISYPIDRKNYEDLREGCHVPRILVAVMLADNEEDWLSQTEEQLVIRHCGFWASLKNLDDLPESQDTATIRFPRENIFNVETLRALMAMVADGGTP